jgi:translocation and assembly module TamA
VRTKRGWRRIIGIDYRYEDYKVTDDDSDNFNGLVPDISWSKVVADDPLNTRNGYRVKAYFQGTSKDLLSTSNWLSGQLNYKLIKSFTENMRFIGRADLGAIWADSVEDVPASQRFFTGGDNSIRGWGCDVLGPNDSVTNKTVGGRSLAVGSFEPEHRISGNWGGAVFTDFGNAFDPDYEEEWEQSVGMGVRYATPIGPVRIDLAYALTKDPAGFRLHLSLGPDL